MLRSLVGSEMCIRDSDETTRLVVASVVSFRTGQLLDTRALVARAHEVGALVFLDAVQALGSVAVEVGDADYVCAASFKWLLGVHGAAGLYVSPRALEITHAPYVGYRGVVDLFPVHPATEESYSDARRYQEGLPDYAALAVLHASLEQLAPLRDEIVHHIPLRIGAQPQRERAHERRRSRTRRPYRMAGCSMNRYEIIAAAAETTTLTATSSSRGTSGKRPFSKIVKTGTCQRYSEYDRRPSICICDERSGAAAASWGCNTSAARPGGMPACMEVYRNPN